MINNTPIYNVTKVKYLGMWMDYKLTWNDHAKHIIERIIKKMNIIKVLRGTWWGGQPQVLLNIYKGIIKSLIDYNSFLIKVENTKLRDKLNKLQYQAIRLAMGYRTSTPINLMLAESCVTTLSMRSKNLSNIFAIKMISLEETELMNEMCAQYIEERDQTILTT